jgi:cytochrome c oxidase assembly protein subunit 15
LHRFTILLAAATLFLVVAGGLVVSMEAGLSVPDWPLSYGKVMPPMEGGVFYEHGHRMIATAVGFLTVVLAIWLQARDSRAWMKRLGWVALAAVIAQGVLGGLTVLYLLPKAISISHACLAQLFFSTTVLFALFTSQPWQQEIPGADDSGWPNLRTLAWLTPLSVLAQIALGAAFRHKALGFVPHLAGSLLVAALIFYFALVVMTEYGQLSLARWFARMLLWITGLQMVLGIVAYLTRLTLSGVQPAALMVGFTVAHVATGALTMAFSLALGVLVLRSVRAADPSRAPQAARA